MPAGCEFICKNEKCKNYNSGFVLTAPWPLCKIQNAINSSQIKNNKEFKEELIKIKNSGKKLVCITYPNIDKIPSEGLRVQFWSEEAKCIWEFEVKDNEEIEKIDKKCPKTGCDLRDFSDVTKDGIKCPECKEKLLQSRWFTNED